jgi:hypothetical protein
MVDVLAIFDVVVMLVMLVVPPVFGTCTNWLTLMTSLFLYSYL